MIMTDPIADMLSRIRNASQMRYPKVSVPHSTMKVNILRVLVIEGYIGHYLVEHINDYKSKIIIFLKYIDKKSPIHEIKRISKPSRRLYVSASNIPIIKNGFGIAVLSTSKGIISNNYAFKHKIGGEELLEVW